ncbi:MAG TPA: penicillin-binding protein 2 [Gemmatimonadaceae bacterium]|nr:penicillin-binding protein 2 [Gemmatimonadaceae bacterium]
MSFHPNDVARRGRGASIVLALMFGVLLSAFFRTQILQHSRYTLQSEENRLREVPLPAPRGVIYGRNGQVIAENVPGYSVSLLNSTADSLQSALHRMGALVALDSGQIAASVRRYRRSPNRPTLVLSDAPFDVVSVLEEHRIEFPGLIIQSAPKRYYPAGSAVAPIVGYVGEITEAELASPEYQDYKAGQQVGKRGLEEEYEKQLRGKEGVRFVEVDALGRVVREAGARQDLLPQAGPPLQTNIDMDLQRFTASIFGDSLSGGAIALDPNTGAVLALYSAPTYDPNQFIGGIPSSLWKQLSTDKRHPLYNKVIQGTYPPGSTWKLATATIALENGVATLDSKMPLPCTGGYQFGTRYFRCWKPSGHGDVTMSQAITQSCDVYFYQLGLKIGLSRLAAGGVALGFRKKTGIDLPGEQSPSFPLADAEEYYDRRYGKRGWTEAVVLNLAIGQGENSQTVANMARFYTALATNGEAATPEIVKGDPKRTRIFALSDEQMAGIRAAMAGVTRAGGTAASAAIKGVVLAGKTGSAQNSHDPNRTHAWFVGFAPADHPKIVVAVLIEFGGEGARAARIAAKMVQEYLKVAPTQLLQTDG